MLLAAGPLRAQSDPRSPLIRQLHPGIDIRLTLADRSFIVINSIDTPVCHVETQKWQQLRVKLPKDTEVYTVSMDLPFALLRWSADENVDHPMLSAQRSEKFGADYGVLVKEWRLLQRAVFVIDGDNVIKHAEYVADQMREPDYDGALKHL